MAELDDGQLAGRGPVAPRPADHRHVLAADLLAGHDAGRLRLLTRTVERLDLPDPERALDALWLLTGFAAYDDLTRGRGLSTAGAAELLAGLAEAALRAPAD